MTKIPHSEDIAELPRWAQIAFAARCARRVQPLYRLPDGSTNLVKHLRAVERAIVFAEQAAAHADAAHAAPALPATLSAALSAAHAAADDAAANAADAAHVATAAEAAAAAGVAHAAAHAAPALPAYGSRAANAAHDACDTAGGGGEEIARDLERLWAFSRRERWTNQSPVPQSVFGPMWPDGEPAWYREGREWQARVLEEADDQASHFDSLEENPPVLSISIDHGTAPPEKVGELLREFSLLYRELGGSGLDFIMADADCPEGADR